VRLRLTRKVTLRGEYTYEDIDRDDAEEWFLPSSTRRNTASLTADVRVARNLKAKLKYTYRDISDPAVNVEPDHSNEGSISVSWMPVSWLNALVSYRITEEVRNDPHFLHTEPAPPVSTGEEVLLDAPTDRENRKERFLGAVTFLLEKNLTATMCYFYMHNKLKEAIAYHVPPSGFHFFDPDVENRDTVHSGSVDVVYLPRKNITLNAGASVTESKGAFQPSVPDLLVPVSVAAFSQLKMRETICTLGGEYAFWGGLAAGVHYKYARLEDLIDNPYDGVDNGEAHIVMLTLSKRW
jgi:hypothetical protein